LIKKLAISQLVIMWYSLVDCLIVFVYIDQRRWVNLFKRTKVVMFSTYKWNETIPTLFSRVRIRSTVFIFVTVSITSLYVPLRLKNENFVVKIYRCFTVKIVKTRMNCFRYLKLMSPLNNCFLNSIFLSVP
jgi:hypothetical protein